MGRAVQFVGYGIVAAGMPWVAPREAAEREPEAAGGAVSRDGFSSVLGTTRVEAAVVSEKGTQKVLICTD
jgi:hypothetical protein